MVNVWPSIIAVGLLGPFFDYYKLKLVSDLTPSKLHMHYPAVYLRLTVIHRQANMFLIRTSIH